MSHRHHSRPLSTCRHFDRDHEIGCVATNVDCQRFLDTADYDSLDADLGCCDCDDWADDIDWDGPLDAESTSSAAGGPSPTTGHPPPAATLDDQLGQRLAALQLHASPSAASRFEQLPVQDRRILQRMLAKRQDQWQRNQRAHVAHERWQHEQLAHRRQQQQHAADIAHRSQQSRAADRHRFAERRTALWQRDRNRTHTIRDELRCREHRAADRLDEVRTVQQRQAAAKQTGEALRQAEASGRRAHIDGDRKRRQLDCVGQLADRLHEARVVRDGRTEAYRQRVAAENDAQAALHAKRLLAVRSGQREGVARAHRDMAARAARGADFVRQRADGLMERRGRAMWTAELRELVRDAMPPLGDGGGIGGSKGGSSGWATWRA